MKTQEKIGKIVIEHQEYNSTKNTDGANYFRKLVEWMNSRNEHSNQGKSRLELMKEFNNQNKVLT